MTGLQGSGMRSRRIDIHPGRPQNPGFKGALFTRWQKHCYHLRRTCGEDLECPDRKLTCELKGHRAEINSAEFSPDSRSIVTASNDFTAKIWNASTGKLFV
jgi:WD40 repeat protein